MKLATTTGDFMIHTRDQFEAIDYIAQSGFKYIDYNFGMDLRSKSGVFSDDWKGYIEKLKNFVESKGLKLVQTQSPASFSFSGRSALFCGFPPVPPICISI